MNTTLIRAKNGHFEQVGLIKGTVNVISSDSLLKKLAMPDSQLYPFNIYLKIMRKILYFLGLKVFYSNNFYVLLQYRNEKITLADT